MIGIWQMSWEVFRGISERSNDDFPSLLSLPRLNVLDWKDVSEVVSVQLPLLFSTDVSMSGMYPCSVSFFFTASDVSIVRAKFCYGLFHFVQTLS